MAKINRAIQACLLGLIAAYRYLISPWLGNRCRFYPSCSCYAQTALQQHGIMLGCGLIFYRLLRCHPYHPGGHDPVPTHINLPIRKFKLWT